MPTGRSEERPSRRSRLAATLLAALLGPLGASGCSVLDEDDPVPSSTARPAPAPDVAKAVQRALDRRAAAVRAGDVAAFRAGLGRSAAVRAAQATVFANLQQLPLGELTHTADPATLVRDGDSYWVEVETSLRLEGYDAAPAVSRDRWRFRPARAGGRWLLTSVTDPRWEERRGVQEQPWERPVPLVVRDGAGVLLVLDEGSAPAAEPLLAAAERAVVDVDAAVPYEWPGAVVLYALADPAFLVGLPDVPGGDPERLDAVAFDVPAAGGAPAATRVVLNPRLLADPGPQRERLLRHEITHVALGIRDDALPVWLAEGVAEHVSVQPMPPEEQRVPAAAVEAARRGLRAMPDDATFNDADSAVHYAVSWWACEYLARNFDDSVLWAYVDRVARGADPDQALRDLVGLGTDGLARAAGRLLLANYR